MTLSSVSCGRQLTLESFITSESLLQQTLSQAITGQRSTKVCKWCHKEKPLSEYQKRPGPKGKAENKCKECMKHHSRVIRSLRKSAPPKPEVCDCCKRKADVLCLDHNHITESFRGWLCINCNSGLGKFGDSVELLTKAIAYLSTPVHGNKI